MKERLCKNTYCERDLLYTYILQDSSDSPLNKIAHFIWVMSRNLISKLEVLYSNGEQFFVNRVFLFGVRTKIGTLLCRGIVPLANPFVSPSVLFENIVFFTFHHS